MCVYVCFEVYILDIRPLEGYMICKNFLPSRAVVFSLSWCPWEHKRFFILMKPIYLFSLVSHKSSVGAEKPRPQRFIFYPKSFIVLALAFMSDPFCVNFYKWWEVEVQIDSFGCGSPVIIIAPFVELFLTPC